MAHKSKIIKNVQRVFKKYVAPAAGIGALAFGLPALGIGLGSALGGGLKVAGALGGLSGMKGENALRRRQLKLQEDIMKQLGGDYSAGMAARRQEMEKAMWAEQEPRYSASFFKRGLAGTAGAGAAPSGMESGLSKLAADIGQRAYMSSADLENQRQANLAKQLEVLQPGLKSSQKRQTALYGGLGQMGSTIASQGLSSLFG